MTLRTFRPASSSPALLAALDEWIRRDLHAIFGSIAHEPIPAELAEIVQMIEPAPPPPRHPCTISSSQRRRM
jgi:hypothetical protein